MNEVKSAEISSETPSLDSLFEDVFGLNVRGLRTIYQLIVSPKTVFESARVADWRRKYTPTIRLTFSIITVFMLLSFFWAAEDGMMYQALMAQIQEAVAANPDAPSVEQIMARLDQIFAAYSFFYPILYMILHGIVASLVFVWGKGTGWVTRIRLYFGLLAVGMTVSLVTMFATPFLSKDMLMVFTFAGMTLSMLAYWVTYVRGMWGMASNIGILARATGVAMIIVFMDMVISSLAGIGAGLWVTATSA